MQNHLQHLPGLDQPFAMIAIKGGRFDMGGESETRTSLPVHPVEVDDFWMGEYQVTQALWTAVMGENSNPAHFKGHNRPVENVSWNMIVDAFLPALNQLTINSRPPDTQYRLPTEAEWEYAAGNTSNFSGSNIADEAGWYSHNSHNESKPTGLKLPNEYGLYDMTGNVSEWCNDWLDHEYYLKCLDQGIVRNPFGPNQGIFKVYRGGSWYNFSQFCRNSVRLNSYPLNQDNQIGFRLVLSALLV